MPADPKFSAGARAERKSFRSYLRRKVNRSGITTPEQKAWAEALAWVIQRQQRYDRKVGGLGKK